jgi:trafficking protein particle complex subunit 12
LNSAFTCIFDEQYSQAIEQFKKVLKIKPASLVATNNIAVCQIFMNQTTKAIDLLQDLINQNPKRNTTETIIANLMAFYEIQYPTSDKTGKSI